MNVQNKKEKKAKSKEKQIAALTNLMVEGVFTAEELTLLINALNGKETASEPAQEEKTPAQLKYEDYIANHVAYAFKSPSSVKAPPLEPSMIKEGKLNILSGLKYKPQEVRYIETYVDAPNSYGTMLRQAICIIVDNDFNPQFVVQNVPGLMGGPSKNWMKMPGVK